jgi:predicted ester cyclase
MSVEEENKALINRVTEALNRGDLDAFDELFAPVLAQDFKEDIAEIKRAFPDYHGTEVIQIAEGDFVASRIMFYSTHRGEFMGLAPTGEQWMFEGLSMVRMKDGKIVEDWVEIPEAEFPRIPLLSTRVNRRWTQALNLGAWHHGAQGKDVEQGGYPSEYLPHKDPCGHRRLQGGPVGRNRRCRPSQEHQL